MSTSPTRRFVLSLITTAAAASVLAGNSVSRAHAAEAPPRQVVYVSVGGEKHINIYDLDPASGKLTLKARADLAGSPGALAADATRHRLYAGLRPNKSVETLKIDPATGALTSVGVATLAANPVYLAVDAQGKHILTADYGGNIAASYPLKADGSVSEKENTVVATPKNPHAIILDASNRFAFVPICGEDQVLQFELAADGKLVPNDPPAVKADPVDGPRHIVTHPSQKFVYVVNEKSSSVTAYAFDKARGTLKTIQKLSTLPADNTLKNTCADIHVTPDGRFLYASNRGHDSLAMYRVDPVSGRLTHLGNVATEKTPRDFGIDATGTFVIAAGQGSGKLATYRIDKSTGKLQPLSVYEVGKGPAWVEIVTLR